MTQEHRIALVVDHPERDLAGIVLTAAELCRRGARPYLVSMSMMSQEIWALAPDQVVLNYFRPANEAFARRLMEAGINVSLLDTEGGGFGNEQFYASFLWNDRDLLKSASTFCFWGERLAIFLTKSGLTPKERVQVTGCPRHDFYNPRWRPVLLDGTGTGRRLLLLNGNHGLANPRFVRPEKQIEFSVAEYGRNREEMLANQVLDRRAMESLAELAGKLANDFPEFDVVLRPHPFERMETYRSLLPSLPNLSVIQEGPVQPWIARASAVIQKDCSTAIEAGMAGVPAFSPGWYQSYFILPASEAVSVAFPDYEGLRNAVAQVSEGTFSVPQEVVDNLSKVVADWLCSTDGNSHRRVCDALLSVPPGGHIDQKLCRRHLYELEEAGRTLTGWGNQLRHALRLHPSWSFARMKRVPKDTWTKTPKYFSAGQVQQLVDRISRAAGWEEKLRVRTACDSIDYRVASGLGYAITIERS